MKKLLSLVLTAILLAACAVPAFASVGEWCDNLPDYRMPQDMGFTGYNKSWITPDFGPLCAKRLAEKK